MTTEAPTVTIAGCTAQLVECGALASLALAITREELVTGDESLWMAHGAAALFLCWPTDRKWPTSPRPRPWHPGLRMERYGHGVFDALGKVAPLDVVVPACLEAFRWAQGIPPQESEVKAAEDFSEPPEQGA